MTEEITTEEISIDKGAQTETYKFDSRTKTLVRVIRDSTEVKVGGEVVGEQTSVATQTYTEEGIRKLVQQIKMHNDELARQFASVNRTLDVTKHIEHDDELEKLQKQLENLKGFGQRKQAEASRDFLLKDSEATKEQLRAVLKAIGNHIKVD